MGNKKKQDQKAKEPAKKPEEPKKANPFDQKVKAAFDDIDDLDLGLDSDRKGSAQKNK